jgi:hypothetical protein
LLKGNSGGGACSHCRHAAPGQSGAVLTGIEEHDPSSADGLADLSRQLACHGIRARSSSFRQLMGRHATCLWRQPVCHQADLLVMGLRPQPYARNRFGGFTQSVHESTEIAVFLMH